MTEIGSCEDPPITGQVFKGSIHAAPHIKTRRFYFYQLALFFQDVILIFLSFLIAAGCTVFRAGTDLGLRDHLMIMLPALMMLSFFPTFRLYNYHSIFLRRYHLIGVARALCWGLFSSGAMYFLYGGSGALISNFSVLGMLIPAIFLLFIGRRAWNQMIDFVQAMGLAFLAVGLVAMLAGGNKPSALANGFYVPAGFVLAVLLILPTRVFLVQVVFNDWLRRRFRTQVAVIGTDEEAKRITAHVITHNAPFWVAGFLGSRQEVIEDLPVRKTSLGSLENLPEVVDTLKVEELVITDEEMDKRILIAVLDYSTSAGINVWFPPKLMPIIDIKLRIDRFCGLPMIRLCSQRKSWLYDRIKTVLEFLFVLPMFVLLMPLFLAISVAIKLTSPGPLFYRARAIGKDGKEFLMYKFRSMQTNTDTNVHREYVTRLIKGEIQKTSEDQLLKITNDPRVTGVGRIIRKLSLDELPQLINVIKGDMSLVGPRPCLPYEYELYKEWHKKRQSVRPGITGLWQVTGRSEVLFEDMVLLDLYYIYNRSLLMDLNIVIETVFVVVEKKGAV